MERNFMFSRFWCCSKRGGRHVWESVEEVEAGYARAREQEKALNAKAQRVEDAEGANRSDT